ncbi:DMRTA factor, partial [Amia calva]|nr:DMRTA factor [Amia calva]
MTSPFPGDKMPKYNLYNSFMGRPLFSAPSGQLSCPVEKTCPTQTPRDKPLSARESPDKDTGIQSPGSDHLSGPVGSPGSLSSSDLESGGECERPGDFPSPERTLSGSTPRPRDPTAILVKIFPHHKRDTLESVVKTCQGDIVKAIELVLNSRSQDSGPPSPEPAGPQRVSPGVGLGPLSAKSAFSPLQSPPGGAPGDSVYGVSPRLGISPLRFAYSTSGAGLPGFMSPYVTPGLMHGFPLRPPMDYSFPGMIRDFSYLQSKDPLCNTGLYSRLNPEKP